MVKFAFSKSAKYSSSVGLDIDELAESFEIFGFSGTDVLSRYMSFLILSI